MRSWGPETHLLSFQHWLYRCLAPLGAGTWAHSFMLTQQVLFHWAVFLALIFNSCHFSCWVGGPSHSLGLVLVYVCICNVFFIFIRNIFKCIKGFSKICMTSCILNYFICEIKLRIHRNCNKKWLDLKSGQRTWIDIFPKQIQRYLVDIVNIFHCH